MAWVGEDLKDHLVPTLCCGQSCQPFDQAAQGPIQTGLECLQRWVIHSFSGQPVSVPHHLLIKIFEYWKAAVRSPQSFLFSRLNKPNSLSFSTEERCSSPLIIFVALLWTAPTAPHPSCAEGPRPGCSTPDGASWGQSRGAQSPLSALWPSHFWCSPVYSQQCNLLH